MKKAIDWVKEAFEGQKIESIYLYNTSQSVCIGGIEVESGDLLLFNKNKNPVKIVYKPAFSQGIRPMNYSSADFLKFCG